MSELPSDLAPDELNAMIAALAREHEEMPHWVYSPDLVELGEIPVGVYGYNAGCTPSGVDRYREGQKWRRKLIEELKQRPEWIAEWRALQDLNRRIRELCAAKDLQFRPWECPPWRAPDEEPEPDSDAMHMYGGTVPAAVRLRRQLIRELEADACPAR